MQRQPKEFHVPLPNSKNVICALHGFLGLPSDWKHITMPHIAPRIAHKGENFWIWASNFNESTKGNILMGYSLGGRLAMHALLHNPQRWKAAILISAHPGYTNMEQRKKRVENDLSMAKKFETEEWTALMNTWNQQECFKHSAIVPRFESDYDRQELADTLRYWSLGKQDALMPQISKLDIPIFWIVGKNDLAYVSMTDSVKFAHPKSKIWLAPNAGHRVPWDTKEFQQNIEEFIYDCKL